MLTDPLGRAAIAPAQISARRAGDAAPPARTLLDIFTATEQRHPDALALSAPDAQLTYRELRAAATDLAHRLRRHGVGAGDRVAVRIQSGTSELYVAILGVLHVGAAYVPIDADDPPARVADILLRSGARLQIGDGLALDGVPSQLDAAGTWTGLTGPVPTVTPDSDAWIIFTSGSTGVPKGVSVTHRSAAAFVDAEARLWSVTERDRVLAGLSVGFDASCEEMWLAWGNGAALIPAPRDLVRAGVELGDWLVTEQITVVSTVPTLAALWDESCLHQVRLLILGGEACPEPLGWRLAAGREVWNTYGPTEATVVSTAAPIRPGAPIRIGEPLDGWDVAVLEDGRPVPDGGVGELVIGGVGLGRYLDPRLDAERFAPVPELGWPRGYRTGDLVIRRPDGLEFVGRRDDQVKVGGRRIELGELEAALCAVAGVRAAAVVLRESAAANQLLVGYVVGEVDPASVRAAAARRLPSGIVPLVVVLEELPLAPSGKVDRRALPWPAGGDASGLAMRIGSDGEPLTEPEAWLAELWVAQLGPVRITRDSDFFALGGASLAAAKLTSVLRRSHPAVAVADLYHHPTLRALAGRLAELGETPTVTPQTPGFRPRAWFGPAQILGVVVLFGLRGLPWLMAAFAYSDVFAAGLPHIAWGWLIAGWLVGASAPARVLLQVGATRLLTRGVLPGRYRRDSAVAWRLWFLSRLAEVCQVRRVAGTPFAARYARLLGARVGPGARLASLPETGALVSVGAGATVEGGVDLRGWWIEADTLVIGPISVGAGARVGTRTLLEPGTQIGAGAEIEAASVVGGVIPPGERWGGVPAAHCGDAGQDWPAETPCSAGRVPRTRPLLFAASVLLEQALLLLAAAPGVLVLWALGGFVPTLHSSAWATAGEALLDVALWVPTLALLTALTLRWVWRLVTPGYHADYGLIGWALWFGEELRETAASHLFPIYASLFTAPWLRLMGIRVGRRSEISTSTGLTPLVSFGELAQCTDDIGFAGVRARNGLIHVSEVSVGDRSFLGPGSVLRGGTRIGPDSLVGVLTLPPRDPAPGTSWLGVPALELPRAVDAADPARTIAPPPRLIAARGLMDVARLLVPTMLAALAGLAELGVTAKIAEVDGVLAAVALMPLILFAGGLATTAVTVALKWVLIGRYRPGEHPLWSWFVWRDEFINAAQEQLAVEGLLSVALGTPLMGMYLAAMGARVGTGTWIETTAVTEYEMIELGTGVAINRGACLMTHLFHDRLLRIGPARLADGSTLGPTAATLPDTVLGCGVVVGAHSVVLRGEELPDGTRWHGSPVSPA